MEDWKENKNNDNANEYIMFDDKELENFSDEPIESDEIFDKTVSKEIDEYLKVIGDAAFKRKSIKI